MMDDQHPESGSGVKSKTIHMVRHGQGEHNVTMDPNIPDPLLTDLGREQCTALRWGQAVDQQKTAELLITSPLRRALETAVIAFTPLIDRIGPEKAVVLDTLQETGVSPSATPTSPLDVLRHSQNGIYAHLNYDLVSPGYASKKGIFKPERGSRKRVKAVLKWMHEREEDEVVLVSHGDFMNDLVSYRPSGQRVPPTEWDNCELITFKLQPEDPSGDGTNLVLVRDLTHQSANSLGGGKPAATVAQMGGQVDDGDKEEDEQ